MEPSTLSYSADFEERLTVSCPQTIINQTARACQFLKRDYRKISPLTFVKGLSCGSPNAFPSLNIIAATMALMTSRKISKQAVGKRMSNEAVTFLKHLLKLVIAYPLKIDYRQIDPFLQLFSQV